MKSHNSKLRLPDFIIVGAQKSGTTALFKFLNSHPEIYLPPQKEVQFFSVDNYYSKGLSWYSNEFYSGVKNGIKCGDISPQYMFYKKVPPRIAENLPDLKLIAILRNPIERAYSHYRMSVRRAFEKKTFHDALVNSVKNGLLEDNLIVENSAYYQFSCYSAILSEYLKFYNNEKILILFQEDLNTNPIAVLKKIFSFIGVDACFVPPNPYQKVHQSGTKRFTKLESFIQNQSVLKKLIKPILSKKYRAAFRFWLEQYNVKPNKDNALSKKDRKKLSQLFIQEPHFLKKNFSVSPPWED